MPVRSDMVALPLTYRVPPEFWYRDAVTVCPAVNQYELENVNPVDPLAAALALMVSRCPPAILGRILTTGDVGVYTAADGSRFLGLDYSTVDLTDAEAAYLEELGR